VLSYLRRSLDAGSVPCSTTKHKGPEESPGLFSCLKSAPGARATLNKSLARRASRLRAVCFVDHPRHSCGYGCGLRLAFHPAAGRAPSREPIQRGPRARLPVLRGTNRGDCASGQGLAAADRMRKGMDRCRFPVPILQAWPCRSRFKGMAWVWVCCRLPGRSDADGRGGFVPGKTLVPAEVGSPIIPSRLPASPRVARRGGRRAGAVPLFA
jgi:hypothetical protein